MSQVGFVAEIRLRKERLLGLRTMCQQSLLDMLSSEDGDDTVSYDEEDEHNAWDFFLEVVGKVVLACGCMVSPRTSSLRGQL